MHKNMENKVFLLGIDGFDFRVLLPLVKKKKLPNFEKVIKRGIARPLRSTLPPHSAPAWTSMVTGVKPEKHGITFFHKVSNGEIIPLSRLDRKYPAIWNILSKADLKSVVMNVPMTFPPEKIKGIFLSGTLQVPEGRTYAYPEAVQGEALKSKYVLYPKDLHQAMVHHHVFGKKLATVSWKRARFALKYVDKYDWNFFMLVLRTFDVLIHTMYPIFLDSTHPYFDRNSHRKFRTVFLDYCMMLDKILGKILERIDERTTLLITSDHGCSAIHKYVYPASLLQKLDLLKLKNPFQKQIPQKRVKETVKEKFYDLLGTLHLLTPAWEGFYRFRARTGKKVKLSPGRSYLSIIDLKESKVLPFGHQTLVVRCKTDKEAKKVMKKVETAFTSLTDPHSSENPVVRIKEIKDPQTKGEGNYLIFFEMKEKYEINKLVRGITFRKSFKGKHSRYGVFIGFGRGIHRKKHMKRGLTCCDLPPTILNLLRVEIPTWMDGKSLIRDEEN